MKTTRHVISLLLSISLIMLPMFNAQAAMVANAQVIDRMQQQTDRDAVLQLLQQKEARDYLISMGVQPSDVEQRVNMMTSEELTQLNAQMAELPAGGDILGLLLLLFIIFIITDIIGATDIFPFVHPVR
jgi:predicted proteasome-type protease